MRGRVVVGMSGGVDSAVAAYVLKQQGYEVLGLTIRTWESDAGSVSRCCDIDDAREVAEKLDIPYHVINCADDFKKKVTQPFIDEYISGRTPNPCVVCNRVLKWDKMLHMADVLEADLVATGHYAGVIRLDNGRYTLRQSGSSKDQTYMLYMLTQDQLKRTIMPLCDMTKEEVRRIADEAGIPVAQKPDSQEICFVPDDDYAEYILEHHTGELPGEGDFVDEEGNVIGRHKGIINYTVGQRKGLGIAMGHPVFVKRIDPERNEVVLADDDRLYTDTVRCRDVNFMGIPGIAEGEGFKCKARIRYHHTPQEAEVFMEGDELVIRFSEPVRAAAPGQSAVMYDDDGCVALGAVITGE